MVIYFWTDPLTVTEKKRSTVKKPKHKPSAIKDTTPLRPSNEGMRCQPTPGEVEGAKLPLNSVEMAKKWKAKHF